MRATLRALINALTPNTPPIVAKKGEEEPRPLEPLSQDEVQETSRLLRERGYKGGITIDP